MNRIPVIYAVTAIAFLLFGLYTQFRLSSIKLLIPHGSSLAALPVEVPYNAFAVMFCTFALLYSIRVIPFSKNMTHWHLGLTIGSAVVVAAGLLIFIRAAQGSALPIISPVGYALIVLLVGAVPVFFVAQAWFVVDLFRSIAKMRS